MCVLSYHFLFKFFVGNFDCILLLFLFYFLINLSEMCLCFLIDILLIVFVLSVKINIFPRSVSNFHIQLWISWIFWPWKFSSIFNTVFFCLILLQNLWDLYSFIKTKKNIWWHWFCRGLLKTNLRNESEKKKFKK